MSCDNVQLIEIAVQCESHCSSSIDDVACYAGGTHYLHGLIRTNHNRFTRSDKAGETTLVLLSEENSVIEIGAVASPTLTR